MWIMNRSHDLLNTEWIAVITTRPNGETVAVFKDGSKITIDGQDRLSDIAAVVSRGDNYWEV